MRRNQPALLGILLLGIAAGACAPSAGPLPGETLLPVSSSAPTATTEAIGTEPPAAASPTADVPQDAAPDFPLLVAGVAAEMGVAETGIAVDSYNEVEFNDSCLGLAEPGEMCLQVITPGYRVVLQTPDGQKVFHTNRAGDVFREAKGLLEAG